MRYYDDDLPKDVLQAWDLGDPVMLVQKVANSIWNNFCLACIALNSRSRPWLILLIGHAHALV